MPFSTIRSKGRLTLPIEVRQRLGLKGGDKLEFAFEDGETVVRHVRAEDNPFTAYLGALPAFSSREEIIQFNRNLRGHDELDEEIL